MNRASYPVLIFLAVILLFPSLLHAETLAMLNYESKPGNPIRQEGITVIDVDPHSSTYGQTLMDIPLPHDLVAHHIFYNRGVAITTWGGDEFTGRIEYYDRAFLRLTRDNGPNVFLLKKDIKYLLETQ